MKNILSKKLVSAAVISGMSLIPFNAFATSAVNSLTQLTRNSTVSNSLLNTKVCIKGDYYGSNNDRVIMSFEHKNGENRIKLDLDNVPLNSTTGNNDTVTVELFGRDGECKNGFTLNGKDIPKFNESAKKFNNQQFEDEDYLRISSSQSVGNVCVFGELDNAKRSVSRNILTEENLSNAFLRITQNGLKLVEDEIDTNVGGACWTDDRGFAMLGEAGTNFGMSNQSDKKELCIYDSERQLVKTISNENSAKSVNNDDIVSISSSENKNNYDKFGVKISEDTLSSLGVGTYYFGMGFKQNGREYQQALVKDNSQYSISRNASSIETDINNTDTMYFNNKQSGERLSYKFSTTNDGVVKLEVDHK